jgi:hypothetical protein
MYAPHWCCTDIFLSLSSNSSTVQDVFDHCTSGSCINHDCYAVMQEASSVRTSSIRPEDNCQWADRRKNKAKLRMTNAAQDSDVSEESGADSTAKIMEKFSQLSVDGIYAATTKVCMISRHCGNSETDVLADFRSLQ